MTAALNVTLASPLSDLAHHLFYDKSPPWHIANSRIHPLPNTHPVLIKLGGVLQLHLRPQQFLALGDGSAQCECKCIQLGPTFCGT